MADKVIIEVKNLTKKEGISPKNNRPYTMFLLEDGRSGRKARS